MGTTRRGLLKMLGGAALCPICISGARAEDALHWTYEGHAGPSHWGELSAEFRTCAIGQAQTPIDLGQAHKGRLDPLAIDFKSGPASVLNNGHTIQVNCAPGSSSVIAGKTYDLVQFHFHHPSEHRIDGVGFEMECHFVHRAADGGLAVLGVFFAPGASNAALDPVWSVMPTDAGAKSESQGSVDPAKLLPRSHHIYRYQGSLTTPPCSEGLVWTVFREPIAASFQQIAQFSTLFPMNARPIQPLNGRELVNAE